MEIPCTMTLRLDCFRLSPKQTEGKTWMSRAGVKAWVEEEGAYIQVKPAQTKTPCFWDQTTPTSPSKINKYIQMGGKKHIRPLKRSIREWVTDNWKDKLLHCLWVGVVGGLMRKGNYEETWTRGAKVRQCVWPQVLGHPQERKRGAELDQCLSYPFTIA